MTKILYLPTGEYLSFMIDNSNEIYSQTFELINLWCYPESRPMLKSDASVIEKVLHIISCGGPFVERHNIILPAIQEHFEIVEE